MNRYPYHRYLRYLVLDGDDADAIRRHLFGLGFTPPTTEDIEFLRSTLYVGRVVDDAWRVKCDVDIFLENSTDIEGMHWLVENEPARAVVQRALLDGVSARHCAQIVTMKFGKMLSERSASLFRRCFWDTEALTLIDFQRYFAMSGGRKPDPPPGVPLKMRGAFRAWDNGVVPDEEELTTEDIVRAIQVDAFMHFEKAKAIPSPAYQDEARKWAVLAMRASQIRKPKQANKNQEQLPTLKPAVFYPEFKTKTLADLAAEDGDNADGDSDAEDDGDPI